ncbi:MAG: MEDS domain-containing protein, partial [Candidatus Roizmanbacteria bacterium]|nr:MEDS domain-containing protein [Candidatus Roizmanbacteria bacterium]
EGYIGLRGIGEMDLTNNKIIVESLTEYEVKLDQFIKNKELILLCQYNETILSHEILNNIIRTHESVVIYGKLYKNKYFYIDPAYFNEAKKLPPDSYKTIVDTIIEE